MCRPLSLIRDFFSKESVDVSKGELYHLEMFIGGFYLFNIKIVRGDFCLASANISIVRVFRSGYFNDRFG